MRIEVKMPHQQNAEQDRPLISGFRGDVDEICTLLGSYAVSRKIPEERRSQDHTFRNCVKVKMSEKNSNKHEIYFVPK
jgi:hypothetical protein